MSIVEEDQREESVAFCNINTTDNTRSERLESNNTDASNKVDRYKQRPLTDRVTEKSIETDNDRNTLLIKQ